jgi:Cupin-like domain
MKRPHRSSSSRIPPVWLFSALGILIATIWRHYGSEVQFFRIDNFWKTIPFSAPTAPDHVWRPEYASDLGIGKDRCTIERINEESISYETFVSDYWRQKPLILLRSPETNRKAHQYTTKQNMMDTFASRSVPIAGVEAYAFREERTQLFTDYLAQLSSEQMPSANAKAKNVTFNFGMDPYGVGDVYTVPFLLNDAPKTDNDDKNMYSSAHHIQRSWHFQVAVAGSGVGLPFHWHGDVFAEVLHGQRRWFLFPPNNSPQFNPRTTSAQWFRDIYRPYHESSALPNALLECTMRPDEALYVPADWFHATLSLGEAVSITTSFAQQYRQDRYSIPQSGSTDHSYMLDALEQRDFPKALRHAHNLIETYRTQSFVPYSWLGVIYTLQAPTLQSEANIRSTLEKATAAMERCIELNPYYAPCYVWYSRQLMTLSYVLPDRQENYQQRAARAKQMAAELSFEADDELLDPRWQPKPKQKKR